MLVPASWSELTGKCLTILQRKAEGSGEEEEGSGKLLDLGRELLLWDGADDLRRRSVGPVLRTAGLTRSYTTLSLSSFNIISSGSTSEDQRLLSCKEQVRLNSTQLSLS